MYTIGLIAQMLFFARTLCQWFKSEHEGRVLSLTIFWKLSLLASVLMLAYGILRKDAAILLGQLLVYYIYVRNIHLKQEWLPMNQLLRQGILLCPVILLLVLFLSTDYSLSTFFRNEDNPFLLMLWGIAAQLIFISRFLYQWIYSENKKESLLPAGFWIISICGSAMTFVYAIFRLDPVLLLAHSLSLFIYLRNIIIHYHGRGLFRQLRVPVLNRLIIFLSGKIN